MYDWAMTGATSSYLDPDLKISSGSFHLDSDVWKTLSHRTIPWTYYNPV